MTPVDGTIWISDRRDARQASGYRCGRISGFDVHAGPRTPHHVSKRVAHSATVCDQGAATGVVSQS